jgi:hypothetical protein
MGGEERTVNTYNDHNEMVILTIKQEAGHQCRFGEGTGEDTCATKGFACSEGLQTGPERKTENLPQVK